MVWMPVHMHGDAGRCTRTSCVICASACARVRRRAHTTGEAGRELALAKSTQMPIAAVACRRDNETFGTIAVYCTFYTPYSLNMQVAFRLVCSSCTVAHTACLYCHDPSTHYCHKVTPQSPTHDSMPSNSISLCTRKSARVQCMRLSAAAYL